MDAVYFPAASATGSSQYCVAIADDRHGVLLYDSRTTRSTSSYSSKPVCVLKSDSERFWGARCLDIVDHGRMVVAGGGRDLDGYVNMWDLRKVSGNVAVTFSAAPNKHQHLRRLCFKRELARVHGLIDEAHFIPCTYPEFLRPDPGSYHRIGFHMRCGWSAVLDLGRLELTHVHAPPAKHAPSETWMDAMQEMDEAVMSRVVGDAGRVALPHETMHGGLGGTASNTRTRTSSDKDVVAGCWLGEAFAVPSATMDKTIHIVDFSGPSRVEDSDDLDAPSAVQVNVSHDAVGTLRVPSDRGEALLSYGTDGTFNVLQRQ
jgi:WD40 repeat protein